MKKNVVCLLLSLMACIQAHPQSRGVVVKDVPKAAEATGNTYGLVIGISKYQHFPSLKFADNDARAFYKYLVDPSGEKVDTNNVRMILNEQARAGDIWRDFSWLTRKAVNKGDRVFIYFSGHGDAANSEEAYLLAHDAPNEGDPNLYNAGGTFQVYNLKSKIKQLSELGVKVILITDACRTNELPGKENGSKWTYNKIMEQQSGEIQMTSCTANERSLESTQWGNGRGVFSWHLVNGLYGLADDDPEDGKVSLYELQKYVKSKVRTDTKDASGMPAQNPMFCCNEMENFTVARVNTQTKDRLIASLAAPEPGNDLLALNTSRSSFSDLKKFGEYYALFLNAVKDDHVVGHDSSSAQHYYTLITKNLRLGTDALKDLHDEYVATLVNFSQQRVNNYLAGKNSKMYTAQYFSDAAESLKIAHALLNPEGEQAKGIQKTRLMLEARAQSASLIYHDFHENKTQAQLMKLALSKLDSAATIATGGPSALLFHTYSLVYQAINDVNNAIRYEQEAIKTAPMWKYPYNTLGYVFGKAGKIDSALICYKMCLALDPSYKSAYNNIGTLYMSQNQDELAATYFKKAIELDPQYLNALVNTGLLFYKKKQVDSALYYYNACIAIDPTFSNAWFNSGSVYYNNKQYDKAENNYGTCVRLDPSNNKAHYGLSCIYGSRKDQKKALLHLELALVNGYNSYDAIANASDLAAVRNSNEYKALMKKYFPGK